MADDWQQNLNRDYFSEFQGSDIIISGGAQGIGAALVKAFHWLGAKVTVLDRDQKKAETLVAELSASDDADIKLFAPVVMVVDMADEAQRDQAIMTACQKVGSVHSFISTLGLDTRVTASELTQAKLERLLKINYIAPAMAARKIMRYMRAQGGSVLLFTSAHGDDLVDIDMAGYGAGKAALVNDIKRLAQEAGKTNTASANIRVNGFCPGWVETGNQMQRFDDQVFETAAQNSLLPVRMKAEDIVAPVVFAVSRYNKLMTGQIIRCDAGGGKIVRDCL